MYRDFTHQAQAIRAMRYPERTTPRFPGRSLRETVGRALVTLGSRLSSQPITPARPERAGV